MEENDTQYVQIPLPPAEAGGLSLDIGKLNQTPVLTRINGRSDADSD